MPGVTLDCESCGYKCYADITDVVTWCKVCDCMYCPVCMPDHECKPVEEGFYIPSTYVADLITDLYWYKLVELANRIAVLRHWRGERWRRDWTCYISHAKAILLIPASNKRVRKGEKDAEMETK